MSWDPFAPEYEDEDVYVALGDDDCREIVERIEGSMTANEISEACEIPLSTTYRKLDVLSRSTLLEERVQVRKDGKHTNNYVVNFERVEVSLEDTGLDLRLQRPETRDERLAAMWEEVRRST